MINIFTMSLPRSLSTFRGSTDSDISNTGLPSDSANSKKMLLPSSLARTKLPEESGEMWDRNDPSLGAIYVNVSCFIIYNFFFNSEIKFILSLHYKSFKKKRIYFY